MSAILVLVNIFLALLAIVLIVAVLMQEGNREGLGAISGGAETFFGKNKAKSVEGKLEMITKYGAAAFIILAIVSTILTARTMHSVREGIVSYYLWGIPFTERITLGK